MNRLILDTDGGVDDAQALLLLIANGRPPDAITTVFGNVDLDTATDNILSVLSVAGAAIDVHKGAHEPLVQEIIHAREIHGEDGLGGAPRPHTIAEIAGSDAAGFLVTELSIAATTGQPIDLLFIGPLTNLAMALQAAPGIVAGIGRLTVMGATVYGRGNVTPAAEFNIYADPEAAAVVLGAQIDTVIVPWEPCVSHVLTGAEVDGLFAAIPESDYRTFSLALVSHARKTVAGYGRGDVMQFVDPLAAAVVVEPEIVTRSLRASVDVALAPGLTRGMTVVDPSFRLGTPPVTIIEAANLDRLKALYARSIGGR
ncbi:nucleoside hydrolase [Reyranella sp.]|uniref:nucleoside hydrolase n=1 Tax=Reyranella sp. TaxID=1929291 RepID=UPI003D0C876A